MAPKVRTIKLKDSSIFIKNENPSDSNEIGELQFLKLLNKNIRKRKIIINNKN